MARRAGWIGNYVRVAGRAYRIIRHGASPRGTPVVVVSTPYGERMAAKFHREWVWVEQWDKSS